MSEPITAVAMRAPLDVASSSFSTQGVPNEPSQADINAFAAQMNRAPDVMAVMPEQQVVEQVQSRTVAFNDQIAQVMPLAGERLSPEAALDLQQRIAHTTKAVDITVKVAGSLSQTVKQLLSMQ